VSKSSREVNNLNKYRVLYLLVEFEVPHEVSFGGIPVAT
jgi:hypothetical protein